MYATSESEFTEQRSRFARVELVIQSICLIVVLFSTIYHLQTARSWEHPSFAVGMHIASAIGISVGVRESRIKIKKRLQIVTLCCGVVAVACVVWEIYTPLPRGPGDPIVLYTNHPIVAFFVTGFLWAEFSCFGMIIEEVTAFTGRRVGRWLNR